MIKKNKIFRLEDGKEETGHLSEPKKKTKVAGLGVRGLVLKTDCSD